MRRIATGGPLNYLNERGGCNARSKTVPVMALLDAHPTDDPAQLRLLIESHSHQEDDVRNPCPCGVRSTGPVEKFALGLFEAQFRCVSQDGETPWVRAHRRYSFEECLAFHLALFCEAPIRGRKFELSSRKVVQDELLSRFPASKWTTRKATQREDCDLAVDYVIRKDGVEVAGVQVKPSSTLGRSDVVKQNAAKHARAPFPVHFHFYDDSEKFLDTEDLCASVAVPPSSSSRPSPADPPSTSTASSPSASSPSASASSLPFPPVVATKRKKCWGDSSESDEGGGGGE